MSVSFVTVSRSMSLAAMASREAISLLNTLVIISGQLRNLSGFRNLLKDPFSISSKASHHCDVIDLPMRVRISPRHEDVGVGILTTSNSDDITIYNGDSHRHPVVFITNLSIDLHLVLATRTTPDDGLGVAPSS
jgi:hypothetical protein